MPKENQEVKVTVVGAGIAGLTAALRLAERGYKVKVYEHHSSVGGNLGSYQDPGSPIRYDIYPHMLTNWYLNFWQLVKDIGLDRYEAFKPLAACKFLKKHEFPHFTTLPDTVSFRAALANLFSGLAPAPDVFLWAYSIIDLLSQRFDRSKLLGWESVNGFICSRPYATDRMAQLHDDFIQTIWAVHSYLTSASAYQDYLKYQVRDGDPQSWVLRGNAYDTFMDPLLKKLRDYKCEVTLDRYVDQVFVNDRKVVAIRVRSGKDDSPDQTFENEPVEHLVLAVPANYLAFLVMGPSVVPDPTQNVPPSQEPKEPYRIVDILPELAEIRRLHGEVIPVLDVYFKTRLCHIPEEYVALVGSQLGLTFVSIPTSDEVTALAIAASDFYALPDPIPKVLPPQKALPLDALSAPSLHWTPLQDRSDEFTILQELHRYVPVFKLGKFPNDNETDVDWNKTRFHSNTDFELYVNEVGSERWSVKPNYEELPNLFFAGDFCENDIGVTCVETAVVSGLKAAQALRNKTKLGDPILILPPKAYSPNLMALVKLGLAPYAFGAKVWSEACSFACNFLEKSNSDQLPVGPIANVSDLVDMLLSPYALGVELWRTIRSVCEIDRMSAPNDDPDSASYRRHWRAKP